MIVQLTLIWRSENIICNMASGSLIGSIFDLVSATTVKVDGRSSFSAWGCTVIELTSVFFLLGFWIFRVHGGRRAPFSWALQVLWACWSGWPRPPPVVLLISCTQAPLKPPAAFNSFQVSLIHYKPPFMFWLNNLGSLWEAYQPL